MTKPAATQNDTATVGAQFIAPEASPEYSQNVGESGWRACKLGSTGRTITGKTPSKDNPEDWGSEVLFITPSDYKNYGKKAFSSIRMLSKIGVEKQKNRFLPIRSVLVTCIGSDMGKTVINALPCVTNQQINAIIPDQEKVDSDYLYYVTKDLYETLSSLGSDGTAVPILNKSDFENIDILLPPLPEQKAIAAVLSSLDDKIDLLHRQNQTLEAMAQTLFRQWFIEEAREDWEESSLLELIELVGGGTPKTSEPMYWDGVIPWLSGGDIAANHKGFVNSTQKSITVEGLNNSSTKLLPKFSTVISARGTVGKYCLLSEEMAFSQSNYGILPKVENCYFFTNLLIGYAVDELQSAAYGSVFDTITTSTFKEAVFLIPPFEKILQFEKMISFQFVKQLSNQKQIKTLTQLRDMLLPKLMSGEIRVEVEYE